MRLRLNHFILSVCVALIAIPAMAQYQLKGIVFEGTTPYSQADLESVCGLRAGARYDGKAIEAAAQRLVDTGAFDSVAATVGGTAQAITANFKIKPVDPSQLYAATFENFIWWQADELTDQIHKLVPLFHGSVPEAGNEQQAVVNALTQILAARGTPAKVVSRVIEPYPDHPATTVDYLIATPLIQVGTIKLSGVSLAMAGSVGKAINSLSGRPYTAADAGLGSADGPILEVYRNAGYLDASLEHVATSITQPAPDRFDVQIAGEIKEGEPYRVSKIEWPGSPQISAKEFDAAAKLHPGEIASHQALIASLKTIDTAYRRQGYMDVIVDAAPLLNAATHQVAYSISVAPGEQYRLSTLTVVNLPAEQRAQFDSVWKMKRGDIYDVTYVMGFLRNNSAVRALSGYSGGFQASANPQTHLVDLTITFIGAGDQRR